MKILHKDCDFSLANDVNLPINSYVVIYNHEEKKKCDIVQASCFVEVFDNYYDEYGKGGIESIKWTNGKVNPKIYGYVPKESKKKR